jgi:hypothetical protein
MVSIRPAGRKWRDSEHNVKILFTLSPVYLSVENMTTANFKVRNLKTGSHLKNETATLTVLNNLTANINKVIN